MKYDTSYLQNQKLLLLQTAAKLLKITKERHKKLKSPSAGHLNFLARMLYFDEK